MRAVRWDPGQRKKGRLSSALFDTPTVTSETTAAASCSRSWLACPSLQFAIGALMHVSNFGSAALLVRFMGDDVIRGMRERVVKCRWLASMISHPEAKAVLLQMAAEGETDIRKLEEAGRTASDRR